MAFGTFVEWVPPLDANRLMLTSIRHKAAFAGLGYLSLFLAGKLHLMDNRGEVWKTVIVLVPLLAAALVAVSRIMDARHHPFDVITGAALGLLTASIAYRQYFPPLSRPEKKGRAFPPRTWGTDVASSPSVIEQVGYVSPFHDSGTMEEGMGASSLSLSLDLDGKGNSRKRSGPVRSFTGSSAAEGGQEFELLTSRAKTFSGDGGKWSSREELDVGLTRAASPGEERI